MFVARPFIPLTLQFLAQSELLSSLRWLKRGTARSRRWTCSRNRLRGIFCWTLWDTIQEKQVCQRWLNALGKPKGESLFFSSRSQKKSPIVVQCARFPKKYYDEFVGYAVTGIETGGVPLRGHSIANMTYKQGIELLDYKIVNLKVCQFAFFSHPCCEIPSLFFTIGRQGNLQF